jgi:hypothetical protein
MKTRYSIKSILASIVFFAGLTEASAYSITFTPNGAATCSTAGFNIPVLITYDVPSPGPLHSVVVETLNNVVVFSGTDDFAYAGSGSSTGSEVNTNGFPVGSEPYTFSRVFTFEVNGVPFERVNISFTCNTGDVYTSSGITNTPLGATSATSIPTIGRVTLMFLALALMLASMFYLRRSRP